MEYRARNDGEDSIAPRWMWKRGWIIADRPVLLSEPGFGISVAPWRGRRGDDGVTSSLIACE